MMQWSAWRSGARLAALATLAVVAVPGTAEARSFVVLTDNGTIASPSTKGTGPLGQDYIAEDVVKWYRATGQPLPQIISIWTTFDMDKSPTETLTDPQENDVTGIGYQTLTGGGDGTFTSSYPPV